jgi:hypothetical protein
MRGSRGCGRLEASVPGEEVALGWRGVASVFFRRARLVAPVLLQIREKVRGKRLDKMRRTGGIRGSGNNGNLMLMASQRSSPTRSPGARTRRPGGALAKLAEGKWRGERGGSYRHGQASY